MSLQTQRTKKARTDIPPAERRRRIAIDNPQTSTVADPILHTVEMIGLRGTDPETWTLQASSVFSVDLEASCPVWHLRMWGRDRRRGGADGEKIPIRLWPEELKMFYRQEIERLIPQWELRKLHFDWDHQHREAHCRTDLMPVEQMVIPGYRAVLH